MSENNYEQLTFDFERENEPDSVTDELFTENDMDYFRKDRKGSQENGISRMMSSELRMKLSLPGNNVNGKGLHYSGDWIDDMIEKMYVINMDIEREETKVGNVNEWLYTNIVQLQFDSQLVKKFMQTKLHVSFRVYKTMIEMFRRSVPVMESLANKKQNEFNREDYLKVEVIKGVIERLDKVQLGYYQSFLNSLKPFRKIKIRDLVNKQKNEMKFDHILVRYAENVLKKERNTQPQSFYNTYYCSLRIFVNWATSTLYKFQYQSNNNFIFNMVTSQDLDDYKSFLIKQVNEEELAEITAKRNLQYVRGFFQLLYRKRKVVKDITTNLTNLQADEYFYRRLPSDKEIQQLIDIIERYSSEPLRDKLALSLMLLMGFRGCEVASLSWDDINFSTRSISITETKGMDAVLPIPSKVYELLILYKNNLSDKSNKNLLFCKYPTSFTGDLRVLFDIYQSIAGWDYGGGLHIFRHLFVTRLIMHCPPQIIKSLTRHVSDDTVAKYVHLEQKYVKDELKKFNYLGGRKNDF